MKETLEQILVRHGIFEYDVRLNAVFEDWQKQQSAPTSVSGVDELAEKWAIDFFGKDEADCEIAKYSKQGFIDAYTLSNKHTVGVIEEQLKGILSLKEDSRLSHQFPLYDYATFVLTTLLNQLR